ncbi:carbohydrate-binding protein [Pseudolabrys sp. Root1462]|uniref:nitrous oxide reductase family maturation protein NosD n=1 Tax=Pseudolabrys sp. Root1462 TaxID=1736466 RepID=UPI000702F2A2|nr:nitrous oxide reductase family maturation protein NosD [Pseudolabrys sp. Root1462]KQY99398.1 carbohydrate-binding protein [Pseudolabrys sp. Root1462]
MRQAYTIALRRLAAAFIAAVVAAWLGTGCTLAATVSVTAGGERLRTAIAAAAVGDVLQLEAGVHDGPVVVDKPLTLEGRPGAVVDGGGRGRTIEVVAPGVTVRGLGVRGSGIDHEMDAGIYLEQSATGAKVLDNTVSDNLVGVYVHGASGAIVRGNTIVGRTDLRLNDRGNGVYVWNAPGAQVIDNDISGGRDGIFTNTSRRNVFRGNRIHGVRFAVHYMYTNDSEVSANVSVGNHAGYVIMFSDHLKIHGNVSRGDRDHGLLLNYANDSRIDSNVVSGSQKCVFIYNANKNDIAANRFENCAIGIHFTAGSERNAVSGNAFINNQTQVKYVGTRSIDWSVKGRGNYWSDNPVFDLNGDGIADAAYRPNDLVDRVVWAYGAAKLLLNSPVVEVLRWAQSQFPALHPGGVVDSAPLMTPPQVGPATETARLKQGEAANDRR